MEPRTLIAYGLIALMIAAAALLIAAHRRAKRRRRGYVSRPPK